MLHRFLTIFGTKALNAFHLFGRGGRCEARGRALPLGVPRFEEMLVTSNVPSGQLLKMTIYSGFTH